MKILYIGDRRDGGISRHVQCLRLCMPHNVKTYEIGYGGDEEFIGRSGHDIRELYQIWRAIKRFNPDIVHMHTCPLWMSLYIRFFSNAKRIVSLHMQNRGRDCIKDRLVQRILQPCYYLPVSQSTWNTFMSKYPKARGEVFYNPLKISGIAKDAQVADENRIVGMVGRDDPDKGWEAFVQIANNVEAACLGVGVTAEAAADKFGDKANAVEWKGAQPNGRQWIARMSVFVLTSKHEEMPTVVLEALAEKTPICGFIPAGGLNEILEYSSGPLKKVFIRERDTAQLTEIVRALLTDNQLRAEVANDGWQIVANHFDADKLVKERLLGIYRSLLN